MKSQIDMSTYFHFAFEFFIGQNLKLFFPVSFPVIHMSKQNCNSSQIVSILIILCHGEKNKNLVQLFGIQKVKKNNSIHLWNSNEEK